MGTPGCRAGKTPLRIQIRQVCTPPNSVVRVQPQLDSEDEQSCWLGSILRHCRDELGLTRCVCQLWPAHPSSPSRSDFQHCRFHCRFHCSPHGVRSEYRLLQRNPQCWGRLVSPAWFSFPTGGTRGSGETSLCGEVLSWQEAVQSVLL